MGRPVADLAAVSLLALIITVAIAFPVLLAPHDRVFGMEIVGRHHDPFTTMEQFGSPVTFGIYAQPLTDIPGKLLARMSGPVAAYNWLVLLTFPLSAVAAYLLARHLQLSPASAAIAAFAFAFSPFHLAHAAYHPHVAQTQWVPLYLLALWRCLDRSTPAAVGLLATAIAGVTLSNFYGGLIAAVTTPLAIAAYWFFISRREPRSLGHLAITVSILAVGAAGGAAYVWLTARALVVDRFAFGLPREDLFRYSARWWSYLVPPVEHPLLGGIAERVWNAAGVHAGLLEQQVSLGWGVVALACVAAFSWLLRGRRPMPVIARVPVLVIVAFVALVCSLSPERDIGPITFVRPSAGLYQLVPMFRSYARFGVVVQLMTALLAGIGAARLWRARTLAARGACVALVTLAAGEYVVWPPSIWRDVLPTSAHRWVANQPNHPRVLDCVPLSPESASIRWLSGDRIFTLGGTFDDCAESNIAGKLSAAGYTHLIVRSNSLDEPWIAGRVPEGLRAAARLGDAEVFAVTARIPLVFTTRMTAFDVREYSRDSTWRWMRPGALWTIVNTSEQPLVAAVDIELSAFHHDRHLTLLLDGLEVQRLSIEPQRRTYRFGPWSLIPGEHELGFLPAEPPTVADDVISNGDRRPLSFAFGSWRWVVERGGP
jgi:hypothetical protein